MSDNIGAHKSIKDIVAQLGATPEDTVIHPSDPATIADIMSKQPKLEERMKLAELFGVDVSQPLTGQEVIPNAPVITRTEEGYVTLYDVTVDFIIGNNPSPLSGNVGFLSGRVTDVDLENAGVDKEYLLRIRSIVPAGVQKI